MVPATPPVFVDANVLYSAALRDILIELTLAGVIRVHWSAAVLNEVTRALQRQRPDIPEARLTALFAAMNKVLPDALVPNARDDPLKALLPDPDDLHILAAALQAGCGIILTFNVGDFPAAELGKEDAALTAMHPDLFFLTQLTANAAPFLNTVTAVQSSLSNPVIPMSAFIERLERIGLPQTSTLLKALFAR
jgi:predicted nucleic acid-binding protein